MRGKMIRYGMAAAAMAVLLGWGWLAQRRSREAQSAVLALRWAKTGLQQRMRERVADLAAARERLAQAAVDKEVLYREVHHRVRNNLQVVSSLLHLQAAQLAPEIRRPFEESVARICAMSLVHDIIYHSDHPSRIDFAGYLRAIAESLLQRRGAQRIALLLDTEPAFVDLDTAVPLALIVNELIGNAIELAFPGDRSGTLKLNLAAEPAGLRLTIADDCAGSGGAPGPPGFGTLMVEALAGQIGATVAPDEDGGMRFLIFVPGRSGHSD
jgi:two-component system, sensor histidine kinase PdtaS